ncbi:kinase-like protein, partial [Coprinellus micaceus]
MHSDAFDVIPYDDIKGDWKKLGSGSFGNVYKGTYLGIDVAIKEVLPSTDYDVSKYFEREWRLMKECRHPNICLFIGLSRGPVPPTIYIVSEFIDGGNVRSYIHNKRLPFPWRLRLSFATDIARALAYLHARQCIHRDMKGENLLVTGNGRIKVTDFGFARIAARNEDELRRLTFCGTDSYMSPEILLGDEFSLPTDIFSLGVIFCEIAARKLADDRTFKRTAPTFGIDADEVRKRVAEDAEGQGCPKAFVDLAIECCNTDPSRRPGTRQILERLRVIEAEVLARKEEGDVNVGSVRFISGAKRPHAAPRIPSFGMGVGKDIRHGGEKNSGGEESESSSDDEELLEAVERLSKVGLGSRFGTASSSLNPLLPNGAPPGSSSSSVYSTTVIRHPHGRDTSASTPLSSVLTVRASPNPASPPRSHSTQVPSVSSLPNIDTPIPGSSGNAFGRPMHTPIPSISSNDGRLRGHGRDGEEDPLGSSSIFSIATLDSYHTAAGDGSAISSAAATIGESTMVPRVHRFTLLKPGAKPKRLSFSSSSPGNLNALGATASAGLNGATKEKEGGAMGSGLGMGMWNPLEIFFSSGLLVSRCEMCAKR